MLKEAVKRVPYATIAYDQMKNLYRDNLFKRYPERQLQKRFVHDVGYELNLEHPRTFNEKLQWLKLYWYDERVISCVDKVLVRDYVKSKGLGYTLNELITVFDSADHIDISSLPEQFVLKANHGSGWNVMCLSKDRFDWKREKGKLQRWMHDNYFYHSYEWPYKEIKPRILCEKIIDTTDGKTLKDYKVLCFDGEPRVVVVMSDKTSNHTKSDFYTCDWQLLPVKSHYPNSGQQMSRPDKLDDLLTMAKVLSDGFPHVRIDGYIEGERIIFGEMTFFHASGLQPFEPPEYDNLFGDYLQLPDRSRTC